VRGWSIALRLHGTLIAEYAWLPAATRVEVRHFDVSGIEGGTLVRTPKRDSTGVLPELRYSR